MLKKLFLPLLLLTLSYQSVAEDTPVDTMFTVMAMDKQLMGGFDAMMPMIDQMAAQFKLDSSAKGELKEIYRVWFFEDIDQEKLMAQMKVLYSKAFTNDEIIALTKFYQTPLGKKFLEKSPELMQQGAQLGMMEAQAKQQQLMQRLGPFMQKHSIK